MALSGCPRLALLVATTALLTSEAVRDAFDAGSGALDASEVSPPSADVSLEISRMISVTFVTAETRGRSLLESVADFPSRFGARVVNLGLGKSWTGFKTKVELLRDYLVTSGEAPGERGESNRDHYVAFVDGKDVFWGGCSPEDFLGAYARIVEASGASIVFGAEVACGEQNCNKVPPVPGWASGLAGGRDLNGGFWEKYNEGCKGTWDDECAAKRDCGFTAPCAKPPSVKFLNSGFFMGPVDDLTAMLEWSVANFDNATVYGDQSVFSKWWELNPDKLALDYLGELSLQISDLGRDLLSPRRPEGIVERFLAFIGRGTRPEGIVWNNGFDRVQCLIHGNGRGGGYADDLLRKITDGQDMHGARGW